MKSSRRETMALRARRILNNALLILIVSSVGLGCAVKKANPLKEGKPGLDRSGSFIKKEVLADLLKDSDIGSLYDSLSNVAFIDSCTHVDSKYGTHPSAAPDFVFEIDTITHVAILILESEKDVYIKTILNSDFRKGNYAVFYDKNCLDSLKIASYPFIRSLTIRGNTAPITHKSVILK